MAHQQRSVSKIGLSVYSELIRSNHDKRCQDKHLVIFLVTLSASNIRLAGF